MKEKAKPVALYVSIWNLVEAVILLVAGVCFFIFSGNSDFQGVFITIIGALLLIDGSFRILSDLIPIFFIKDKDELHTDNYGPGVLELTLGIVLLSSNLAAALFEIVALLLGSMLIVTGSLLVIIAIIFLARKLYKLYLPVVEILLGAVLIVLGSLVLVFGRNTENFAQFMIIMFGIVFICTAIVLLCVSIAALKVHWAAKKIEKEVKKAIDAEETEAKKEPDAEFDATKKDEPAEDPKAVENKDDKPAIEEKK